MKSLNNNVKKRRVILVIIAVILTFLEIYGIMLVLQSDGLILPPREGHNADIAFTYHAEKYNCSGKNCGPSCSLQARMWVDEYREDHNLTYETFLTAIWCNDMRDWFYY